MPFYEYRCPNGHTFELFKKMSDPPPEQCEVCGAAPVELVLYPVAIHYKGSGFYSTDYGKGGKRKGAAAGETGGSSGSEGGGSGDAKSGDNSSSTTSTPEPKKAAEA